MRFRKHRVTVRSVVPRGRICVGRNGPYLCGKKKPLGKISKAKAVQLILEILQIIGEDE